MFGGCDGILVRLTVNCWKNIKMQPKASLRKSPLFVNSMLTFARDKLMPSLLGCCSLAVLSSNMTAALISSHSVSTIGSSIGSPWRRAMFVRASSSLPLDISQRGLKGRKNDPPRSMTAGTHCRHKGSRHASAVWPVQPPAGTSV